MTDTTQTSGKWRNWLLIGSLALNLAFIGLLIGASLRDKPETNRRPPAPDMLRELVKAVPKDHRQPLRQELVAKKEEMAAMRTRMRESRRDLVRVLGGSEFDISQVVAIFDDHRVILSRITRGGHEIIVRRIENMSQDERQEFAANLVRHHEKRGGRK
jgi:uncharacterized membrane protein